MGLLTQITLWTVTLYDQNIQINKRECIGHIQRRMSVRLCQCGKKNKGL